MSDSFRVLLEPHYEGAFRFACYLTGDVDRAKDVLHEALIRALKGFRQLKEPARFKSWLLQIVGNVARNEGRSLRVRETLVRHLGFLRTGAAAPHRSIDERQLIGRCLLSLPDEQREALVLFDFEGERAEEIAQIQGVGEPTVRSRILYARRRFRALYREHGGQSAPVTEVRLRRPAR